MFQPDSYRKLLLNRATATQPITEYIENCLNINDESVEHAFHKIMILHWADRDVNLFNMTSEYFGGLLVPVHYQSQNIMSTFYTSNLNLILKIIKLDFIFPYNRNMYNIDILFNDKTSTECFGTKITLDEIVTSVVSKRFNEKCELDLSDFCNDPDFKQNNIYFYKIGLLSHYKTIMTRMGRDTKLLNLSNNNLSQAPQDILNFFSKGNLVAIDFSNNMIRSLTELQRVNSRIESLWLEGNPLCEELDAISYIKQLILKFPRLTSLDDIHLNLHGVMMPFYRNFLVTTNKKTKLIIEKFITLYFAHYDSWPRDKEKLQMFYEDGVNMSISTNVPDAEIYSWPSMYKNSARNNLSSTTELPNVYRKKKSVLTVLELLPRSVHDLTSFCVDVLLHNKKHLILVIDGVFKEIYATGKDERYLSFRRTLLFTISYGNTNISTSTYLISKEMLTISPATPEQVKCFKDPVRKLDTLALVNPDREDIETLCSIFMHIAQLKSIELCEQRLKACNWDIKLALMMFQKDVQNNEINPAKLMDNDDFTDTSSLLEDEVD